MYFGARSRLRCCPATTRHVSRITQDSRIQAAKRWLFSFSAGYLSQKSQTDVSSRSLVSLQLDQTYSAWSPVHLRRAQRSSSRGLCFMRAQKHGAWRLPCKGGGDFPLSLKACSAILERPRGQLECRGILNGPGGGGSGGQNAHPQSRQ